MYDKSQKKLMLYNILDILKKYTDENHTLSQKEIEDILLSKYNMSADRKSIKTNLINLIELGDDMGYEIKHSETSRKSVNKSTGKVEENVIYSDFYIEREITDAELRLIIDSLLFSNHIPYKQCKELIKKLSNLSNVFFNSRMKHIATMPEDKTNNQQIFLNIDLIDEAISHKKKIQFKYLEYDTSLKQNAKKNKDGNDRIYKVSPYQMVAKEGKYYLICNYDFYDDVSNYRVDRIKDIQILDEKAKPFEQLNWSNGNRLDLTAYMKEHVYMYSSDSSRIKLKIINPMISDVIEMFGKDISFSNQNKTHVTVSLIANEAAVLQFAKNYAPDVVILEPKKLREKAIEELRKGLDGYER